MVVGEERVVKGVTKTNWRMGKRKEMMMARASDPSC